MANVRIGRLTFHGGDGQDGFFIRGGGLEGLQDGVDVRRDSVDRPNADGVYSSTSYLSPRLVTIGGDCVASSAEKLDHYASALKSLQANRGDFVVHFDMPGKKLWGRAHLSDRPSFKPQIWGVLAEWDVELMFDDPKLFGDTTTFPNADYSLTQVHHRGNFEATPVLVVTGAASGGYSVTGPLASQFTVTRPLLAGQVHTIDLRSGFLRVNGDFVAGGISRADVWTVPPGGFAAHQIFPVGGTASLKVMLTDTFI